MASETSVVTPERYSQGFDYMAYMNEIKVNKARFEGFYDSSGLSEDDARAFKELASRANGPKKMLVLGEDWCGDVVRGLGVLARICESADMEMRIFPRDSHHDIMNEFLKEGKWMSIPVAVFYTGDHDYICHWIERPAIAEREMHQIEVDIRAERTRTSTTRRSAASGVSAPPPRPTSGSQPRWWRYGSCWRGACRRGCATSSLSLRERVRVRAAPFASVITALT